MCYNINNSIASDSAALTICLLNIWSNCYKDEFLNDNVTFENDFKSFEHIFVLRESINSCCNAKQLSPLSVINTYRVDHCLLSFLLFQSKYSSNEWVIHFLLKRQRSIFNGWINKLKLGQLVPDAIYKHTHENLIFSRRLYLLLLMHTCMYMLSRRVNCLLQHNRKMHIRASN